MFGNKKIAKLDSQIKELKRDIGRLKGENLITIYEKPKEGRVRVMYSGVFLGMRTLSLREAVLMLVDKLDLRFSIVETTIETTRVNSDIVLESKEK